MANSQRITKESERLLAAIGAGDLQAVKQAHADGADVNLANGLPLGASAGSGYADIVQFLLDNGANIHAGNDNALREAAKMAHTVGLRANLRKILDREPNVNEAERDYAATVNLLLDRGANVDAGGETNALCNAVTMGNTEMVTLLAGRGANIHVENDYPVRLAAFLGDRKTAQFLADRGADINNREPPWYGQAENYENMTSLFDELAAARSGKSDGAGNRSQEPERKSNLEARIDEAKNKSPEDDDDRGRGTSRGGR